MLRLNRNAVSAVSYRDDLLLKDVAVITDDPVEDDSYRPYDVLCLTSYRIQFVARAVVHLRVVYYTREDLILKSLLRLECRDGHEQIGLGEVLPLIVIYDLLQVDDTS